MRAELSRSVARNSNSAASQSNLGNALAMLGERQRDIEILREAKRAIESGHAVFRDTGYAHYDDYFEKRIRSLDERIANLQ